jgi:hypothetical protein
LLTNMYCLILEFIIILLSKFNPETWVSLDEHA